jgi:hypothetical protein
VISFNLFDCKGKRLCFGFLLAAGIFYCGLAQALPAPLIHDSLIKGGNTTKLEHVIVRLVHLTRADSHNPYIDLEWPDEIDGSWLAPELMSIHGTRFEDELSPEQKAELANREWSTAAPIFRSLVFSTKILTLNQKGFNHG